MNKLKWTITNLLIKWPTDNITERKSDSISETTNNEREKTEAETEDEQHREKKLPVEEDSELDEQVLQFGLFW